MSTCILLRKLTFLHKLLCPKKDTLSSRTFTSLAIEDVYNVLFIVQQCQMLESHLNIDCTAQCLMDPDNSVRQIKPKILKRDYVQLISTSLSHHASIIDAISESSSCRRLWYSALDRGVKGTHSMQFLFRELCRPLIRDGLCRIRICNNSLSADMKYPLSNTPQYGWWSFM